MSVYDYKEILVIVSFILGLLVGLYITRHDDEFLFKMILSIFIGVTFVLVSVSIGMTIDSYILSSRL